MDGTDIGQVVHFTQSVRLRIIDSLIAEGKIPEDEKQVEILNKTLDSLDRSVFTKAKLSLDESSIHVQQTATKVLGEILNRYSPVEIPLTQEANRDIFIDVELSDSDIVPGEMDIGVIDIDYNQLLNNSN